MRDRNMPQALSPGDAILVVVDAVTGPILAWTEGWIAAGFAVTLASYEAWRDSLSDPQLQRQDAVLFLCTQAITADERPWLHERQAEGVLFVGTRHQRHWMRWLWDTYAYPTFYLLRTPEATWWEEDTEPWIRALTGHLRIIEPLVEPPRGHIGTGFGAGVLLGPSDVEVLPTPAVPAKSRKKPLPQLWLMDAIDAKNGQWPPANAPVQGIVWLGTDEDGDSIEALAALSTVVTKDRQEGEAEDTSFVCYVPMNEAAYPLLPYGTSLHFRAISNSLVVPFYAKERHRL